MFHLLNFKITRLKITRVTNKVIIKTRKATGFKSLRINCWKINQATSRCQIDFSDKTCKKRFKTKKNITIKFYIFEIT